MSLSRYAHLMAFVLEHPWAVTDEMLRIIASIVGDRLAGRPADDATIAAALALRKPEPQPARGGVEVIALHGVLSPRANLLVEASGGTSYDKFLGQVRAAVNRPEVRTIVLDIDSPGGSVAGATECANELRALRARKPIVAQINYTGASAAYWLASSATKIHISPSGQAGSVGVLSIHDDLSAALEQLGVKRTFISAGKYKAEGHSAGPLSEEAHAYRQQVVDEAYSRMCSDIAKGRGIKASDVRESYNGRCVSAEAALALGMVDKVATLDETLERLLPASPLEVAALQSSPDTPQEPDEATGQDRALAASWQARAACDLLALQLADLREVTP